MVPFAHIAGIPVEETLAGAPAVLSALAITVALVRVRLGARRDR